MAELFYKKENFIWVCDIETANEFHGVEQIKTIYSIM